MSTMRADNIGDRLGSQQVPMLTVTQGTAKAWWNLNGTGTIAARDSFNISSFTDLGVGQYRGAFAAAMPNSNYGKTYGIMDASISNLVANGLVTNGYSTANVSVSSSRPDTGAFTDCTESCALIHGDPV